MIGMAVNAARIRVSTFHAVKPHIDRYEYSFNSLLHYVSLSLLPVSGGL